MPRTPGHPFYEKLNAVLDEHGFEAFVERECAAYYAEKMGRPSMPPAVYFKVLFIGAVEITFMIALGFQIGIALGWTGTEAMFLGAALSISSSAILVKVLGDHNQLLSKRGKLIIGILVVEDFAAVILLSILSGVATTGTASVGDIWLIALKLALFTGAALVIGALVAPRLIGLIARTGSKETLLVSSLAMAFGLALVAESLGISAAAGATGSC